MWYRDVPALQRDDLLRRICQELQISAPKHEEIEGHYKAVAEWLADDSGELAGANPKIYGQGSLVLGTLNKPWGRNDYDLDSVCELALRWTQFDAAKVLSAVELRIRKHGTYGPMVQRKNRCIRLNYANSFHLDILPACPVSLGIEGCRGRKILTGR